MSEYCVSIEKLSNGYEVEIKDPEIVKSNQKSKGYRNPMRSYVFTTSKDVLSFLEKNLDKALPDDEYTSTFDAAVAADDDED